MTDDNTNPADWKDDDLISRVQVARWLKTCTKTIARNNRFKPIKLSVRMYRYRVGDIRAYLAGLMGKKK